MAISVRLDNRLTRRLAVIARARGMSKSELIRRCIDQFLAGAEQEPTAWEAGKHLFGCFNSGKGDLSVRAREVAGERVHAKRARKTRR